MDWLPVRYSSREPRPENYIDISTLMEHESFYEDNKFKDDSLGINISVDEFEYQMIELIEGCDMRSSFASTMLYCHNGSVYFDKSDAFDNDGDGVKLTDNLDKLKILVNEALKKIEFEEKELKLMASNDKPDKGMAAYMKGRDGYWYFKKEGKMYKKVNDVKNIDVTEKEDDLPIYTSETQSEILLKRHKFLTGSFKEVQKEYKKRDELKKIYSPNTTPHARSRRGSRR